jgi:hypothetical protein
VDAEEPCRCPLITTEALMRASRSQNSSIITATSTGERPTMTDALSSERSQLLDPHQQHQLHHHHQNSSRRLEEDVPLSMRNRSSVRCIRGSNHIGFGAAAPGRQSARIFWDSFLSFVIIGIVVARLQSCSVIHVLNSYPCSDVMTIR